MLSSCPSCLRTWAWTRWLAALLHVTAFLELSGDDTVDPDWAVEALEHVGHYLEQLPPDRIEAVREQLGRVRKFARKNKWGKDAVEFFAEYLENVGLGVDE
jgi:hypothetical protein